MARFVFKLQTVLDQRGREEKLAQQALAVQHQAYSLLEQDLRTLEQDSKSANLDMRETGLTGKLDLTRVMTHRRFIAGMRAKVVELAEKMSAARMKVEAARRVAVEATRQRKVIELLRDKQHARWLADQNAQEQKLADEIGTQLAYEQLGEPLAGAVR